MFLHNLIMLFAGHALCDYALQSDFMAKGKNPLTPFPTMSWQHIMLAHCLLHAGMVLWVTNSVPMALAELVIHFITDVAKCRGYITFNTDQDIHYSCKILWAILSIV